MFKLRLIVGLSLLCLLASTFALNYKEKVLYGDDNRYNYHLYPDKIIKYLARSVAGMVDSNSLISGPFNILAFVRSLSVGEEQELCLDERFLDQVAIADCSGFLIASDILATAGHCVPTILECEQNSWVFDLRQDLMMGTESTYINVENIYQCEKIIASSINSELGIDYTLLKLNRPVLDREPLKYRSTGKVPDNVSLFIVGHPSRLPLIIADDAQIRDNSNPIFFVTNTDSFGGNSGSPVFNMQSGIVEGILVRGEEDYQYDEIAECFRPLQCQEDQCRGEDVVRMSEVRGL